MIYEFDIVQRFSAAKYANCRGLLMVEVREIRGLPYLMMRTLGDGRIGKFNVPQFYYKDETSDSFTGPSKFHLIRFEELFSLVDNL